MRFSLFRKKYWNFKNYTLIAFLSTIGLFNGVANAMTPEGEKTMPSSKVFAVKQTLDKDIESAHERARNNQTQHKQGIFPHIIASDGHSVYTKNPSFPNVKYPILSLDCSKCDDERQRVNKYLTPLIQENEKLSIVNALLEKKVKELESLARENEKLSVANALLETKIKGSESLIQENEKLSVANVLLGKKVQESEQALQDLYDKTAAINPQ